MRMCIKGGVAASALGLCAAVALAEGSPPKAAVSKATAAARLQEANAKFLENTGQWDSRALYLSRLKGVDFWVTRDGATFDFHNSDAGKRKGQVVNMRLVGARQDAPSEGVRGAAGSARFMVSGKESKRDARRFGEVVRKDVYPGVSLRYYTDQGKARYDFVLAPGAKADAVALKFDGASKIGVENGGIVLGTQLGKVRHARPIAFQYSGVKKLPVAASYVARRDGTVRLSLGQYDHSKTLVVDPVVYGSYYGGEEGWDEVRSIVSDTDGGVYMVGQTNSARFPILQGPYSINLMGGTDAFVAKLQGDAYANVYAAYFGGLADDYAQFVQLDPFGNLWVAGRHSSPDFPTNTRSNVHFLEQNDWDQWQLRGETPSTLGRNVATGGQFRLTYDEGFGPEFSPQIPWNATGPQVLAALNQIPSLAGGVVSVDVIPAANIPVTQGLPPNRLPRARYRIQLANDRTGVISTLSRRNSPFEPVTEGLEAQYLPVLANGKTEIRRFGSLPIYINPAAAPLFLQIESTFTVRFGTGTSTPIRADCTREELKSALDGIPNAGGTFTVEEGPLLQRNGQPGQPFKVTFTVTNGPTFAPNLEINNAAMQPKPSYSGVRGSDIFVMRWRRNEAGSLDPTDNQILLFGGRGDETLAGFGVKQNDNPTTGEPVLLGFAGTTEAVLPEATGPVTGAGYVARYTYNNGAFTKSSVLHVGSANGGTDVSGFAMDLLGNGYITGSLSFQGNDDTPNNDPANPDDDNFTVTNGVFPEGRQIRNSDAFVRKYTPEGEIVYSAVLGGNGDDFAGGTDTDTRGNAYNAGSAIAVDTAGNAYVTGVARSFNFPRTRGVFGETFTAAWNVFVTKINASGSALVYSTNLRTAGRVNPAGIAVDPSGNAFITGMLRPTSVSFGDTLRNAANGNPAEPTGADVANGSHLVQLQGADDATYTTPALPEFPTSEGFLNVLNPTATSLVYGTYIGGNLDEIVYGPYVDGFGDVWAFGSIDQVRRYTRGTNQRNQTATLPAPFITPLAFKPNTDPVWFGDRLEYGLYPPPPAGDFSAPGSVGASYARDGFLIKFRVGNTPSVASITLDPSTIPGGLGASSNGTVTLSSAAPAGGADVQITLDDTSVASLSATGVQGSTVVTIPAGQTTGTFTVFSRPVTINRAVQVRATYLGSFLVRQLNVVPWLQGLGLTPNDIIGGNTGTGRITLAAPAPAAGIAVELSTDTPSLISFPSGATVNVPAGQTSVTFNYATQGVATTTFANITASAEGVNRTAALTLRTANLLSLTFAPSEIAGLGTTTGTLLLDGKAGSTFTVNLSIAGNPAGYTMPTTVTFAAGESSKTFTVRAPIEPARVSRRVIASRPASGGYLASQVEGTFAVVVASVKSFTIAPKTVASGGSVTGTIELTSPAPQGGVAVEVLFNTNQVTAPTTVIVPSGSATANFTITARVVPVNTNATVTVRRTPADAKSDTLTILAGEFGLSINPGSVLGGRENSVGTITLEAPAGPLGLTINLSSSNAAASVPATVTIPAGQTTVTFPITTSTVTANRTVTITASTGGFSTTAELTVRANGVALLSINPNKVRGGQSVSVTITLDAVAGAGGQVVNLSTSNASLFTSFPATRTVPAGQKTVTFSLVTRRVSLNRAVSITASAAGSSATAGLTIVR